MAGPPHPGHPWSLLSALWLAAVRWFIRIGTLNAGTAERYSYTAVSWSVVLRNDSQCMISTFLPSKRKGVQLLFGAPLQLGAAGRCPHRLRMIVMNSSRV